MKLTLDTNLILEYLKRQERAPLVDILLASARDGMAHLAVTRRIREDVPQQPLASRLNELPELGVKETGSVFRLDTSCLNGPDMLGSGAFEAFYPTACVLAERRAGKRRVPDWMDWDHLHSHMLQERDVFLTWDRGILCLAPELKERFGIVVMPPEDYLSKAQPDTNPWS